MMSRKDMKPYETTCLQEAVSLGMFGVSVIFGPTRMGQQVAGGSQNDGEMVIREVCGDGRRIRLVDMLFYDILAP